MKSTCSHSLQRIKHNAQYKLLNIFVKSVNHQNAIISKILTIPDLFCLHVVIPILSDGNVEISLSFVVLLHLLVV